jgi:hypothetical protein
MKGSVKQLVVKAPAVFLVMGLLLQPPPISRSQPLQGQSSPAPNSATEMRLEAFRMADFILSLQTPNGAIVDEPGGTKVNEDSNMEYALIGVGAAYASSKQDKYLEGLERGIKWLADREEMSDPRWKGSWYFVYSAKTGEHLPSSPGPGMMDARGVDATSALFTYLLYLDQRLSSSSALADRFAANGRAALDFVTRANLAADDLSQSSWLQSEKTKQWTLFEERYSADQGDVYLGMHAGELLYQDVHYARVAERLKVKTPVMLFVSGQGRYALGRDSNGEVTSTDDGISAAFSQGYLTWIWGGTKDNRAAIEWIRTKVEQDGSIVTVPGKPSYSLTIAMLGMADAALASPPPDESLRWLLTHTFDSKTGGVHHSLDPADNSESNNEAGFCVIAILRFLPFH